MALGDLTKFRQEHAAHHRDRQALPFGGWPQPFKLAVMQPFLVLVQQQGPAQAHHARLVAPALHQLALFGIVERETAP